MSSMHDQTYQIKIKCGLGANINTLVTQRLAVEGELHWTTDTEKLYVFNGTKNVCVTPVKQTILTVAGTLAVLDNPLRIYNNFGKSQMIARVFLSVGTVPTGDAIIVDVLTNGTTVFTTPANRPQIAVGASTGASDTIEAPTWDDGDYLTMSVAQIGSSIAGADLVVHIIHE